MLGSWGGERLRRKGGFRARIEALLPVWGQAARGGGVRLLTSGSLGVKERAFYNFLWQAPMLRLARLHPRVGLGGVGSTVGGGTGGRWVALLVGAGGLCPKDRFARRGDGPGVFVSKQLGMPRRSTRWRSRLRIRASVSR